MLIFHDLNWENKIRGFRSGTIYQKVMEITDVLYGVIMEDKGVSILVSVNLVESPRSWLTIRQFWNYNCSKKMGAGIKQIRSCFPEVPPWTTRDCVAVRAGRIFPSRSPCCIFDILWNVDSRGIWKRISNGDCQNPGKDHNLGMRPWVETDHETESRDDRWYQPKRNACSPPMLHLCVFILALNVANQPTAKP